MTETQDTPAADPWAEIRPYQDVEVAEVLERLVHDGELLDALTQYRLPRLARVMPRLSRTLASFAIRRETRGVASVHDFQMRIASYMQRMLRNSTDDFRVEGLERLDPNTGYLFIGNHRDISMDPAFVNYALYLAGRDTVRIAIGDNLLKKPYVNDLMRLNKSFIVPRSARASAPCWPPTSSSPPTSATPSLRTTTRSGWPSARGAPRTASTAPTRRSSRC